LFQVATDWLDTNCSAVNALNVFPVPDGDTGTNMLLTLRSGLRRADETLPTGSGFDAGAFASEMSRGALMGARGNSGVILSQYLKGFASGLTGVADAGADDLARALSEAANAAYSAMSNPVEGTILTVARSAGEAALAATTLESGNPAGTLLAAAGAAEMAVERTPDLLPVLREAGVVDSGGQGLALLLRAAAAALAGGNPGPQLESAGQVAIDQAWLAGQQQTEWGYCTEFVVLDPLVSGDEMRVAMSGFGDSESIVSGDGLIRVHIHTATPEEALGHAETTGKLDQVSIRNMNQQHEQFIAGHSSGTDAPICGVVAVAAGVGFVRVLRSLGAGAIIWGGQSMNPSAEEIAEAAESIPATQVVVLPNNRNIIATARLAAEISSKGLSVIPSNALPEGIAALLVFNPYEDAGTNASRMEEALGEVLWGEVTHAVRSGQNGDLAYETGQAIALLRGEMVSAGASADEMAVDLVKQMGPEEGSVLTIYYGAGVTGETAEALADQISDQMDGLETEVVEGGQPLYPYIVSLD
jgi:DAK2 domain fusion protein YloV